MYKNNRRKLKKINTKGKITAISTMATILLIGGFSINNNKYNSIISKLNNNKDKNNQNKNPITLKKILKNDQKKFAQSNLQTQDMNNKIQNDIENINHIYDLLKKESENTTKNSKQKNITQFNYLTNQITNNENELHNDQQKLQDNLQIENKNYNDIVNTNNQIKDYQKKKTEKENNNNTILARSEDIEHIRKTQINNKSVSTITPNQKCSIAIMKKLGTIHNKYITANPHYKEKKYCTDTYKSYIRDLSSIYNKLLKELEEVK